DIDALAVETAQPGEHRLVLVELGGEAGADHDHIVAAGRVDRRLRQHGDAVGRHHRLAVAGQDVPAVELPAGEPVGAAQGLDRRAEPHHGEAGYDEDAD